MAAKGIRISEDASKVVYGILFGLAILAAIARTLIRFRTAPKFALDDAILLFACICLAAATGLLYKLTPNAYLLEDLDFHPEVTLPVPITEYAKEVLLTIRILHSYTIISWTVIFAAKFCFLTFFRALIDRVTRMIFYWRAVVLITIICGGISLCETFIACPHIAVSSATCLQGPKFGRTLAVGIVCQCLDILTDILLVTIPIGLLWSVRIKTRQKLGIGAFLCLSIVMIIIAIIKTSGIRTSVNSFDVVWEIFWQEVEACAAVIMVSFTAFRSIFLSNKQRADRKNIGSSILHRIRYWFSSKEESEGDEQQLSPSGPTDQTSPHLTLGAPFRAGQQKHFLGTHVQSLSQGISKSYSRNSEYRSQHSPSDFRTLESRDSTTGVSPSTELTDWSDRHGKGSMTTISSQSKRQDPRTHWWQMGIVSNFSVSRSRGYDSQV